MPDFVYLNGEFVPSDKATVSVFDHGFLYGDGLFETMRSYHGRVFLLTEHLDRLFQSAQALELRIPVSREDLEAAIQQIINLNGPDLYIRLTVSRGPGPVGIDPGLCSKPTIVITSKQIGVNPRFYTEGASAIIVKTLRNLAGAMMPEVKSMNFLNSILAKQEAVRAGVDEGFMLNHLGQVTEGTVSNVFIVRAGTVITPPPAAGLLAGLTRAQVLRLAKADGIKAEERFLYSEDLFSADELFFTNSGSEVVPVTRLAEQKVGNGLPGSVTIQLLRLYGASAIGAE